MSSKPLMNLNIVTIIKETLFEIRMTNVSNDILQIGRE